MSERIVLAGLTLAIVWSRGAAVLPFEGQFLIKHVPLGVFAAGIVLSFVGLGLHKWSRADKLPGALDPARLLWPLLVLAVVVIAGSTYSQVIEGVANTFRNLGLNMLAAYLVARLVVSASEPIRFVTVYFVILAVAGGVSAIAMAFVFVLAGRNVAPFHELEFLIIPLVVYVATLRDELTWRRAALVWGGLAAAVLFRKNTGYLVAIGTIGYLWWFHWRTTTRRSNALRRALLLLVGVTFVAGLIGAYSFLRASDREFIPSGNTEFRVYTYERAWQRFLDSPIWGDAFSSSTTERFELYDTGVANNELPTHSDLLDILAHGGLVAFALFAWAHFRVIAAANRYILRSAIVERGATPAVDILHDAGRVASPQSGSSAPIPRHVIAMTHTLVCMMLLAIVTVAFNPLLLNPVRAILIWSQFGFIAGLACHFSTLGRREQIDSKPRSR